jgi:hypothetical protein
MESTTRRAKLRPKYHLLADALFWDDEVPPDLSADGENFLRPLLHYRTTVLIGKPSRFLEYWELGKQAFPGWVGFHPKRCTESEDIAKVYTSLKAESMRSTRGG